MTAVSNALDPLISGLLRPNAYDHPTGNDYRLQFDSR